jgi:N-acetylmuramoyl-L-alanine amidase
VLITDGRPLVRSGDYYILLSGGVWRRSQGDWYVPEDFLTNALANIVSQNIERKPDGSFRLSPLRVNQVTVAMESHPDHLSVVFNASQNAPVKVRDFRDYLEVVFADYLVRPEQLESSADPRLVTAVEFEEQESLGSFRIRKGSQFSSFRQHYFESPAKLVIEVYGAVSALTVDASPVARPVSTDPEDRPAKIVARLQDVVVIDPGHGGVDYGVDAYQDLMEKVITLNIARQIEQELNERGVKARLTRARDVQLPNEHRSAISNFYHCRLFVGIHLGGAPAESTRGPIVYSYSPPDMSGKGARGGDHLTKWEEGQRDFLKPSRQFALLLQAKLNRLFEAENQVVSARLAVLAPVKAPAVLVETGFLTNDADLELLASPGFQDKVADGITESIVQFLR